MQPGERPENRTFFLGHLSPFELVNHLIAFLHRLLGQLLCRVLTSERFQLTIWHFSVDINVFVIAWFSGCCCCCCLDLGISVSISMSLSSHGSPAAAVAAVSTLASDATSCCMSAAPSAASPSCATKKLCRGPLASLESGFAA